MQKNCYQSLKPVSKYMNKEEDICTVAIGDLLRDRYVPELVGVIVDYVEGDEEPYKIVCEGMLVQCDSEYINKYCEVISECR